MAVEQTLEQKLSAGINMNFIPIEVPNYISTNLNANFALRPYQGEAFARFIYYTTAFPQRIKPSQLLFHMATGSGKTLIMAGSILHLYQLGYRNFIFFVNSSTIIEKTKDNFLNTLSSKYLFAKTVSIANQQIQIKEVDNFAGVNADDINIVFTTIHGLHSRLNTPKENSITYEDFEDKKIVLISDEAHHINAETKKGKLNKSEKEDISSWEYTVTKLFNANIDNYLLEFTATADLQNPLISEKYTDKLIFDYPLAQFRKDKYSKEVKVLQAELEQFPRALQAVILNQYRRKVFEKNGLHIKPVILLKSKTIAESQAFYLEFVSKIEKLKAKEINDIKAINKSNVLAEAFNYFKANKITTPNLITELKEEFSEYKCIAVDSKSDNEEKQLIINSLEDENNEYRAVFAVDKLNEGWDVLNLFDIVRLYNTRDADHKSGKVGKTTMSEAQLIGRGARYCPFVISQDQLLYQRKYDEDINNPMRVCEELYYHAAYNPKYISELNKALEQIGIKDSKARELSLFVKDEFKQTDFYKNGFVYLNNRVVNEREDIKELAPSIRDKERQAALTTGYTTISTAFDNNSSGTQATKQKLHLFKDFSLSIKKKALNSLKFYRFNNLLRYFPHLDSIQEFITSDKYLNQVKIQFIGTAEQIKSPSPEMILKATIKALDEIGREIQAGAVEYKGTKKFKPQGIAYTFNDKSMNIVVNEDGDAEYGIAQSETTNTKLNIDLSKVDWYVFNDNYGTDQEKYLVKYIEQAYESLKDKYEDIYLIRNEKHFKLYTFDDGRPLEPDFVLMLKEVKKKESLIYQLFIEPKGQQLIATDSWKEDFLKQIEQEYKLDIVFENKDFKLVGMPFYNEQLKKTEFDNKLKKLLSI